MSGTVGVLAPWAATNNLGDYVIGDACVEALWSRHIQISETYPTHVRPPARHLRRAVRAKHLILAGTNALDAKMERNLRFWVTPDLAAIYRRRVVLMGVGWGTYDTRTSAYTRWVIDQLLDPDALHSVRDAFTAEILRDLGYRVILTGCPSVWGIGALPQPSPVRTAIVTVNGPAPDVQRDRDIIEQVEALFGDWALQPMDAIDVRYAMNALGLPAARILPLSMSGFDEALAQPSVCIGVRLHAGIRALQRGRQAVIVAIDNRAREMVRDFALPVVEYDATTRVPQWLDDAPSGDIMTGEQRAAVSVFMDALAQMVAG